MLSRVADSIYWMARYIERAENIARFIDVNLALSLDQAGEEQWGPLVTTTGDLNAFRARYGPPTRESVIRFLAFDRDYPSSILSCLRAARENARSVRPSLSSEMWLQANTFYLMVAEAAARPAPEAGYELFAEVKRASYLFFGITDATLSRDEGWHFAQLGRLLERADKTSRILDVKYFLLLPSLSDVGSPLDEVQWAALLRSTSALGTYRRRHHRISPAAVAGFLLLDSTFPRSVLHCLESAQASLHALITASAGGFGGEAERRLSRLCAELRRVRMEDLLTAGLHEFVDAVQLELNQVGEAIHASLFPDATPKETASPEHPEEDTCPSTSR